MKNINTIACIAFLCVITQVIYAQGGCSLVLSFSKHTNVLCNGDSTGSAIISVSGGKTPYKYAWSPFGGTQASAVKLNAQKFVVTVTDANGCMAKDSVTITQPPPLKDSAIEYVGIPCYGECTAYLGWCPTGGTGGTYTIYWANGMVTHTTDSSVVNNVCAGTYRSTIQDSNGCEVTNSITIYQPPQLTMSFDSTLITTGCNGKATALGMGGTPPYSYNWKTLSSAYDTVSGLCTGNYCCVITDFNGCKDSDCVSISVPTGIKMLTQVRPSIYPNPNNGNFHLTFSDMPHDALVEISNVMGQLVFICPLNTITTNISLIGEPEGIYFYRVFSSDKGYFTSGKLIVE